MQLIYEEAQDSLFEHVNDSGTHCRNHHDIKESTIGDFAKVDAEVIDADLLSVSNDKRALPYASNFIVIKIK